MKTTKTFIILVLFLRGISSVSFAQQPNSPFGVIVGNTQGYNFFPHSTMEIVKLLNANYVRRSIFLNAWTGSDQYQDSIIARGFKPMTNLNWSSVAAGPAAFLTTTAIPNYTATINSVLNTYTSEVVVIENEELNTTYYTGPIQYYINMLTAAIPVVHSKGLKVTNGGLLFLPINYIVWRSLKIDSADPVRANAYAQKVFPSTVLASLPNISSSLNAMVQRADSLLNKYSTLNIDYVNLHWYADTRMNLGLGLNPNIDTLNYDTKVFKQTVNYLKARTGKNVITNEIGSNFLSPGYITALMTAAVQLNMPYFIYYSGDGPASYDAKALQEPGPALVLRSIGNTYRCFIDSAYVNGGSCYANTTASFNVVSSVCAGQPVSLTSLSTGGPTVWNWSMPGASPSTSTLQNVTVTYSASGIYSITLSVNGTATPLTKTISVIAGPTLTVSGTGTACPGSPATLTASGATSYTWMPGNIHTTTLSIAPSSTTIYTVTGISGGGACSSIKTKTVTVNSSIAISVASSVICSGQSAILVGTGVITYTWLPGNSHFPTLTVTPSSTSVYTLTGSAGSCTNMAVKTISVVNNLTVGITGNGSICSGNSATLIAVGATNYLWMPGGSTASILNTIPLSTTVYTVTGSIGSCTASALKTVSVNPIPTLMTNSSNSVICNGQVVILTASGASSYTFNPGNAITNPASFSPTITTNYTITGAGTNGCKNTIVNTVNVTTCTDIYELKNRRPVSVYPNPAIEVLHVNLKDKLASSEEFIAILIDDTGKEVYRHTYTETEFKVDTKQFSEGIYILTVKTNQREYFQKVVITNP